MSSCRLVTLDITGTCIAVAGSVSSHYVNHTYRHTGVTLDSNIVENEFWKHLKEMNKKYPNFGCYTTSMDCRQWWNTIVQKTISTSGYSGPAIDKICHSLYTDFTTNQYWTVYNDVWPFLKQVKSKGIKIGVISNFDERLNCILNGLGLSPFFDFVLCSYNEKMHKPRPQFFKKAAELTGVLCAEVWHIGDDIIRDYHGAREAGLNALLLLRDENKDEYPHKDIEIVRNLEVASSKLPI